MSYFLLTAPLLNTCAHSGLVSTRPYSVIELVCISARWRSSKETERRRSQDSGSRTAHCLSSWICGWHFQAIPGPSRAWGCPGAPRDPSGTASVQPLASASSGRQLRQLGHLFKDQADDQSSQCTRLLRFSFQTRWWLVFPIWSKYALFPAQIFV